MSDTRNRGDIGTKLSDCATAALIRLCNEVGQQVPGTACKRCFHARPSIEGTEHNRLTRDLTMQGQQQRATAFHCQWGWKYKCINLWPTLSLLYLFFDGTAIFLKVTFIGACISESLHYSILHHM